MVKFNVCRSIFGSEYKIQPAHIPGEMPVYFPPYYQRPFDPIFQNQALPPIAARQPHYQAQPFFPKTAVHFNAPRTDHGYAPLFGHLLQLVQPPFFHQLGKILLKITRSGIGVGNFLRLSLAYNYQAPKACQNDDMYDFIFHLLALIMHQRDHLVTAQFFPSFKKI